MIVGILLFQAVAFSVLSAIVANNKNRGVAKWSIIGFLFGIFGFVAALVVETVEEPKKEGSEDDRRSEQSQRQPPKAQKFDPDEHEKKCPTCAEYVKLEAKACRFCGHEFSGEEVEEQIEEVKREVEQQQVEKQQENITQEGLLHCEWSGNMVHTAMLNSDGTCPACGNPANDQMHPLAEDTSGSEG